MKSKALKIVFESWADFKSRTKDELKKLSKIKGTSIQPKDILIFDSVASYQRLMSEQKYMILATIKNLKPSSIYQLAKLVDRDFANVKKDCETLAAVGFIILEDSGDGRGSKVPKLIFNYEMIEIHLPNMTYSHHLGEAAA